jgi:hypothetical protein
MFSERVNRNLLILLEHDDKILSQHIQLEAKSMESSHYKGNQKNKY